MTVIGFFLISDLKLEDMIKQEMYKFGKERREIQWTCEIHQLCEFLKRRKKSASKSSQHLSK